MKQRNKYIVLNDVKEIFHLLLHWKIKDLLFAPSENSLLQFGRYCIVGGIATIVDWLTLYLVELLGIHYLLAAILGFILGLACNYSLSKFMVFNGNETDMNPKKEFLAYGIIGVVGLIFTLALMHIMTEWMKLYFMISKMIATVLVLVWNFMARKLFIY